MARRVHGTITSRRAAWPNLVQSARPPAADQGRLDPMPRRTRILRTPRLGPLVVGAAIVVGACGGGSEATAPPEPTGAQAGDAELHEGRDVYLRSCAPCHGLTGQGASGPRLAGEMVERYPDVADQRAVIASGPGVMPAFENELTDDELDAIVRYTREVL